MVADLRLIWISHIHADHHTGLIRILAARRDLLMDKNRGPGAQPPSTMEAAEALTEDGQGGAEGGARGLAGAGETGGVPPVLVVGPRQLKMYLEAYSRLEDLCYFFLDCRHTAQGKRLGRDPRWRGGVGGRGSAVRASGAPGGSTEAAEERGVGSGEGAGRGGAEGR